MRCANCPHVRPGRSNDLTNDSKNKKDSVCCRSPKISMLIFTQRQTFNTLYSVLLLASSIYHLSYQIRSMFSILQQVWN